MERLLHARSVVIDERKIASARRTALVTMILAVMAILTAIVTVMTCAEFAAWLLCAEALGLVTTSFLIRADLQPQQRHVVK